MHNESIIFFEDLHQKNGTGFILHYGDLTDSTNFIRIIQRFNQMKYITLELWSHVKVSFDMPEHVGNVDVLGTLKIVRGYKNTWL